MVESGISWCTECARCVGLEVGSISWGDGNEEVGARKEEFGAGKEEVGAGKEGVGAGKEGVGAGKVGVGIVGFRFDSNG